MGAVTTAPPSCRPNLVAHQGRDPMRVKRLLMDEAITLTHVDESNVEVGD